MVEDEDGDSSPDEDQLAIELEGENLVAAPSSSSRGVSIKLNRARALKCS